MPRKAKPRKAKPRKEPRPAHWPRNVSRDYYEHCLKSMPKGAIKADLTKHAPHGSCSPPMWYVHQPCVCQDCNAKFVFTARQQQHWFEVLKIPIYVVANRCANCRLRERRKLAAQKKHMKEMAKRPRHPNEAFFRKKAKPERGGS